MSERVPVEAITPQQMWDVVRAALNEDAGLRATLHARLEREGVSLTLGDAETMARALAAPPERVPVEELIREWRELSGGIADEMTYREIDAANAGDALAATAKAEHERANAWEMVARKEAMRATSLLAALEPTAAERDRLKGALHEIRLGCINPQQVAHNALFREENP